MTSDQRDPRPLSFSPRPVVQTPGPGRTQPTDELLARRALRDVFGNADLDDTARAHFGATGAEVLERLRAVIVGRPAPASKPR